MIANNHLATIDGQAITIRPVRITDAEMEAAFVRRLSPKSRHFRFLGGIKELTPQQVKKMCEVDGHHSMAFVATLNENGKETEIGVSRYAANSEEDTHGMAVTIAVEWQKKGLGRQLVGQLIEFARDHGINKLYSLDLVANRAMRELAIDLGMTAQKDPDNRNQVIYTLSL